MAIDGINNLLAQAFTGAQAVKPVQAGAQAPVSAVKPAGANPFAGKNPDDGQVGIGIKDGAVQTSAAQLGKPAAQMRQLGIG